MEARHEEPLLLPLQVDLARGLRRQAGSKEAAPVAMQAAARTDYEECLACQ